MTTAQPDTLKRQLAACVIVKRGLRKCAFAITRILRAKYSDPYMAITAALPVLRSLDIPDCWGDHDFLLEEIYEAWGKVILPAGDGDPMGAAIAWAKAQPPLKLEGTWPPLQRTITDAALTLLVCQYLTGGDMDKVFYLSCRTLAKAIGGDYDRAARILRLLTNNGYLTLDTPADKKEKKAARYRLNPDRDYLETEITE